MFYFFSFTLKNVFQPPSTRGGGGGVKSGKYKSLGIHLRFLYQIRTIFSCFEFKDCKALARYYIINIVYYYCLRVRRMNGDPPVRALHTVEEICNCKWYNRPKYFTGTTDALVKIAKVSSSFHRVNEIKID